MSSTRKWTILVQCPRPTHTDDTSEFRLVIEEAGHGVTIEDDGKYQLSTVHTCC